MHTRGANPGPNESSIGLNLCASTRLVYTKIRFGTSRAFPFYFIFSNSKLNKTITKFNFEINQFLITGFNEFVIVALIFCT